MSGDSTVLSFHDSLLKESDLALLVEPNWINDKIIGFYFEYLEHEEYRDDSAHLSLITPDVAQFIKLYQGAELEIFLDPLNLHDKEFVFLPINDNQTEGAGGCHWSLLVYVRKDNSFFHYDSFRQSNSLSAQQCSQRLTSFLKAPLQPKYKEMEDSPQQENSYDCGVFVMCFTDALCAMKLRGEKEERLTGIGQKSMSEWRSHIKSLITSLAKRTSDCS